MLETLTEARLRMWQNTMKRNALEAPKLFPLPPTEAAFKENALRGHLAVVIWRECLEADPPLHSQTDHGWHYSDDGRAVLMPTVVPDNTPLAPDSLLKVVKRGCRSDRPCAKRRCTCRVHA